MGYKGVNVAGGYWAETALKLNKWTDWAVFMCAEDILGSFLKG